MRWKGKAACAVLCAAALFFVGISRHYRTQAVGLSIEVIGGSGATDMSDYEELPRVLIYHTHTWEAYEMTDDAAYEPTETWRTMDNRYNMVRIGEELAAALRSRGFMVTHDQSAFEPPALSTSYTRSLAMLEERIAAGERYDYILDIHRDAYSGLRNGANTAQLDGKEYAYVMMLVGKGTGETGSGFDERPDWPRNLALAEEITEAMNARVPGIAREVKIKSGRFNQHVSTQALLIEVGNNRNTLDEALAACAVVADSIADVHAQRTAH